MPCADPETLARALLDPECYPHPAGAVERHETHISWVFLAGDYAYKVKKPVALGFLDFSSLEARRHYCRQELELNRRFAPQLYLDVVEIRGSPQRPRIGATGELVDHAVKMRRFAQEALATALLARGELTPRLVADFAAYLARFHENLPRGDATAAYGTAEVVLHNALDNFREIAPLVDGADAAVLAQLRDWTEREYLARYCELRERHAAGFVRECHGDLHLRNIVALEGRLVPFDCIEFSAALRWNDVMSEAAFVAMDLMDRGAQGLAWIFLNAYLEATGVYGGLAVLRFYVVYCALVRAKIHLLRAQQAAPCGEEATRLMRQCRGYLDLAARCAASPQPALVLMHGYSASGKSAISAELAPALSAVRIRSDVERKRLHGLPPLAASASAPASGLYDAQATERTYSRLADAARAVLAAGYSAVVDATFLERARRARFAEVARAAGAPLFVVDVQAPEALLRTRLAARAGDASDATLAVLERQLALAEPVVDSERLPVIAIDATRDGPPEIATALARRIEAELRAAAAGRAHRPSPRSRSRRG